MDKEEIHKIRQSIIVPTILLLIFWLIKLLETAFDFSLAEYGLLPQTVIGLRGIIFSPFLHSNFAHLSANSVPFFLLTAALYYYYEKKAFQILLLSWIVTGIWVWIFAVDTGTHIGASGVVYALAAFHFMGGILRKEPRMMAFSLLVVFLYGGLVWGIIPNFYPEKNISWESHLLGLLAGVVLAIAYQKDGWQRKEYDWDEEDDENYIEPLDEENIDSVAENKEVENKPQPNITVNYIYKEKPKTDL